MCVVNAWCYQCRFDFKYLDAEVAVLSEMSQSDFVSFFDANFQAPTRRMLAVWVHHSFGKHANQSIITRAPLATHKQQSVLDTGGPRITKFYAFGFLVVVKLNRA